MRKILHRQIGVIIRDTQFVQPHDVGMVHALRDLVFLQEPGKRLVDTGIVATRWRHFEHDQRARLLALRDIKLRYRASREQARAPVAGDARFAETA